MIYTLHFSDSYTYDSREEGITVTARLNSGEKTVDLLAKIDTGASDCLFDRSYAEALGLRVEEGIRKSYATANSRFDAYGHEVSIQVLSIETTSMVYFYADHSIVRNVLGRCGWLDRLRLGLVDYDRTLFLAGYNE